MVKKYTTDSQREAQGNVSPSAALVRHLLDYSKSLEVKKVRHRKVLVNLN